MTKDYKNLAKVAKFHQFIHFGKKFKVLDNILRVYLVFGKILELIW